MYVSGAHTNLDAVEFWACSGATIIDLGETAVDGWSTLLGSNGGLGPGRRRTCSYLDRLGSEERPGRDIALVTISIGGNDIEFSGIIEECLRLGSDCTDLDAQTRGEISALGSELDTLFGQIRDRAPNARILVVGYPRLFPLANQEACDFLPFPDIWRAEFGWVDGVVTAGEQDWANLMGRLLNQEIREAVRRQPPAGGDDRADFQFVDVETVFDGNELCRASVPYSPYLNGLV